LSLASPYTHDEVDEAYRSNAARTRQMREPDREAVLRGLNQARDLLHHELGPRVSTALVSRSATLLSLPERSGDRLADEDAIATRAANAVVKAHVGRLIRLRQQRLTAAILLGGLAGVGLVVHTTIGRVTVFDGAGDTTDVFPWWRETLGIVSGVLGAFAVVLAAMGWFVRNREQYLRLQVEGVADVLADRAMLADLLDEIDPGDNWTRSEFRDAVDRWIAAQALALSPHQRTVRDIYAMPLRTIGILAPRDSGEDMWRVAQRVGPTDFASLVIPRAVGAGMVSEALITDGSSRRRHGYLRAT
jgi:hypothetical protein